MFKRHLVGGLLQALQESPVVTLVGPRQAGKTTLAQSLVSPDFSAGYVTLDDPGVRAAAEDDPVGFVRGLPDPVILDEVQLAPGLFPAIKLSVDRDRRPGRFLLTGSAHVLLVPKISESLAGRMELFTLWPLSQGEIEGAQERFVEALFGDGPMPLPGVSDGPELEERLLRGGFPVAVERASERGRSAWLSSYATAIVQRDVRELVEIERLTDLPRILKLLASHATGTLNRAGIGRDLGIPQTTLQRYLALLENVFLISVVPAWYRNIGQRLIKAPKLLFTDTGLLARLLELGRAQLERERDPLGPLLENFVGTELLKQASWSAEPPALLHYRTVKGGEVDFLLEGPAGRLAAVEVKASATVGVSDFAAMRRLAERLGDGFARGVVLHTGEGRVPFGERLEALPIGSLWAS